MKTIKQARLEKGLTQCELAVHAKVSQVSMGFLERGSATTMKTFLAICKVLEVDPREIEGVVIKKRVGRCGWQIVERPFENVAV